MTRDRELAVVRQCIADLAAALRADDAVGQMRPGCYRERQAQLACLRAELARLTGQQEGASA